jgi:hypothetical protein
MGNWIFKVGELEEAGTVVKFVLGNKNETGEQLLEFCEENCLFLVNTYFEQPEPRLYTWTSLDDQYINQIDYILGKDDGEVLFSQ